MRSPEPGSSLKTSQRKDGRPLMPAPDSDTPTELSLPVDLICLLIAKARQLQGKSGSTDPGASALDDDDMALSALEDRPSDPVDAELHSMLADLPDDAQIDLVTLMWLGREDDGDWHELRGLATQEHTGETPAYLCGTPLLADYLMAGLTALGHDCGAFLKGHA